LSANEPKLNASPKSTAGGNSEPTLKPPNRGSGMVEGMAMRQKKIYILLRSRKEIPSKHLIEMMIDSASRAEMMLWRGGRIFHVHSLSAKTGKYLAGLWHL
jgi:hypothetical protein